MNNDDIKKALSTCVEISCEGCPYIGHNPMTCGYSCSDKLKTDALNLIIEQENEIEKLKNEFKQLETNAEILARGVRDMNHENYELTEKIKQAKIDVLNELKEKCKFDGHTVAVYKNDIEEMIKELKK